MSQVHKNPIPLIAGEDLEPHRLVKMSGSTSRTVVYADAGDKAIGVTMAFAANGNQVAIQLLNADGTLKVTAAGNYAINASVYTANDGKVSTSVAGKPIGILLDDAAADGDACEMVPYPSGETTTIDSSNVRHVDDFFYYVDSDFWVVDANNGGAVAETDAHGGVISMTASDTTVGDNDETYLVSVAEIYKPAAGKYGVVKGRIKFTEANTDDANILFGLLGGDSIDVENSLLDNGAGLADANQWIAMYKVDGGTVYQGAVRDTAIDADTNVGSRTSGSFQELMITIDSASGDTDATVTFFVDGVAGGTKSYTLSNATEMRAIFGVKNGDTNLETLLIDRFEIYFER